MMHKVINICRNANKSGEIVCLINTKHASLLLNFLGMLKSSWGIKYGYYKAILVFLQTISILFFCIGHAYSQNSEYLRLNEILEYYYLQSNDAKKLLINTESSRLDIKNFYLQRLPALSFNLNPISFSQSIVSLQDPVTGDFNYTNSFVNNSNMGLSIAQPINLTGGQLQIMTNLNMMNEFSLNRNTFSTTPIRLSYNQPLINARKNYKFSKELYTLKEDNLNRQERRDKFEIQKKCVKLYMEVLVSDINLNNSVINHAIADSIYARAKIKQSINEITEHDFLQSKIHYEQSKIDLAGSKLNRKKSLKDLLRYLNLDYYNYKVEMPNIKFTPFLMDGKILDDAMSNNPIIGELEIKKTEIKSRLHSAKMQNSFNGDISLAVGLNQYGSNLSLAYQHPSNQQTINIGLRIPVFNWGINKNKYAIEELNSESQLIDIDKDKKMFVETLSDLVDEFNYIVSVIDISKKQKELTLTQYKTSLKLYADGNFSYFDMSEARNQYIQAENKYLEQLASIWNIYYNIRSITLTDYHQ